MFQDIFGVLADPEAGKALMDLATGHAVNNADKVDKVVGLGARGFLFGFAMAQAIGKPFIPIRKAGKLPGKCTQVKYQLEYGEDTMEVQEDSIKNGDRVMVVDDAVMIQYSVVVLQPLRRPLQLVVVVGLVLRHDVVAWLLASRQPLHLRCIVDPDQFCLMRL